MSKTKTIGMPWDFSSLMNEAIRSIPERTSIKRDYIWASEISHDFASRYLKMHNHIPSNPPNERAKRKFCSGHIFEWIVQLILTVCGIIKEKQLRGEVQLPGMLRVSGKLDFIAGGEIIDWELARQEMKTIQRLFAVSLSEMPPIIEHSVERILFRMEQMFSRVPLKEYLIECKSVSGFVGDLIERTNKPRPAHPLQLIHYLLANKMKDGVLVYVNKDSFMCYQFDVTPTKDLVKQYTQDVATMTGYYKESGKNYLKNIPPLAPEVIFEPATFRFVKNTLVEYSNYLSFLYPKYKDFDDFKEAWKKPLTSWNYTFKRAVKGDNMTDTNRAAMSEAKKIFPEWDKMVAKAKSAGAFEKPETDDD